MARGSRRRCTARRTWASSARRLGDRRGRERRQGHAEGGTRRPRGRRARRPLIRPRGRSARTCARPCRRGGRIRVGEYGLDQTRHRGVVRLLETLQRPNATPPPPLAARTSSRASNQTLCGTIAQRRGEAAASPVEAKPPQQNRKRQGDPGRECDDEHGKRNAENERVHPVVVVVPDSSDVPRSRDPPGARPAIATIRTMRLPPAHPGFPASR